MKIILPRLIIALRMAEEAIGAVFWYDVLGVIERTRCGFFYMLLAMWDLVWLLEPCVSVSIVTKR